MSCIAKQPAVLVKVTANKAALTGDLTAMTVMSVLVAGFELISLAEEEWAVDMAGVSQVSSAAVALILEWLRFAQASDKTLRIKNLPERMWPLIRVGDLRPLFEPLLRPAA